MNPDPKSVSPTSSERSQLDPSPSPNLDATQLFTPGESDQELADVLDEYLAELQAGRQPDQQRFLSKHPHLATQLKSCLSGIEFIHRAALPNTDTGLPTRLGDFRIVREVGHGGMGVVYEAEQISLKRRVALKVLRYGAAADSEAMKRFQREAETVAGLHHTNIVPIFAIGCENGVSYYAMQFIEGQSLNLSVTRSPSATEIATWGLQAAEALAHAHQRGVIHRDIKPSNLILDPDGRIWLTDFGLAKRMDDVSLSLAGAIVGTPRYMSPEQASAAKNPVDHRTDIYSLGATLYELATGRPLFEADSPQAVITQILTTEPAAPRVISPDLPRDLETIILKCLAKEPERRYATAQSLADDLRAFVEGRAIKARRATLVEQAARWFKQQKRSVGVAAITVATTIMVIVGGTIAWQMREQSRLGYLTFDTPRDENERAEFAEILQAASDEPVGSPFTLPTKEPVALPEGEYRLRLSSPSKLSQEYLFDVVAGQQLTIDVGLVNEIVGHPIPLKSPVGVEPSGTLPAAGRFESPEASAVSLSQREPRLFVGPQDQSKPTVRCYSANAALDWRADGKRESEIKPIFEADWRPEAPGIVSFLKLPEDKGAWKALPAQEDIQAWQQVLSWFDPWWFRNGSPPKLLSPSRDLNGDDIEDIIWTAPRVAMSGALAPGPITPKAPVLLAVSGKDGQPLWWLRAQDSNGHPSRPLGEPIRLNVAAGERGDVVVCGLRTHLGTESWIEAISSTTGESLWRSVRISVLPHSSTWLTSTLMPNRKRMVIGVLGRQLVLLDADTGEAQPCAKAGERERHNHLELRDNELVLDTRFADLDGDGVPEAVMTVQTSDRGQRDMAFSVTQDKTLWDVPSSFEVGAWYQNEPHHSWPLLADLTGDNKPEVILPGIREEGSIVSDGCRVLDGMTGQPIWTRRFPRRGGFSHRKAEQFTVGPDLDGDGNREVVMASIRSEFRPRLAREAFSHHYEEHVLFVDCFSGRDGRSLWWQRVPLGLTDHAAMTGAISETLWWGDSNASRFRLVIPVHRHPDTQQDGGAHSIYVLSAMTGRIEHQADDLALPQLVDWNNDGLDDLAVFVPDDPVRFGQRHHHPIEASGKLIVLRGSPPEAFRRLDRWVEEQDFDGDGIAELSRPMGGMGLDYAVQIASGRDGRIVSRWKTEWPETPRSRTVGEMHSFPAPHGDFDADGLADLLLARESHFWDFDDQLRNYVKSGKAPLLMQTVSGKSGRRIWGGPLIPIPDAFLPNSRDESSNEWQSIRQNRFGVQSIESLDLEGDGHSELLTCLVMSGQRPPAPGTTANIDLRLQSVALIDARSGKLRWAEPIAELVKGDSVWQTPTVVPRIDASTDLDGDGVCDLIILMPQPGAQSWSYTIQVRSGRDGKALWGPHPSGQWSHSDGLKLPSVGDLDGDGKPELVLLESKQPMVVKVLRGSTGDELWKWKGAVPPNFADPCLAIVADAGSVARVRRCVAVTINETGNQWELVLLDHAGQVAERIPYGTNQIWSHDLDGDGGEELVRFLDTKLSATHGLNDTLWTWSPPVGRYAWVSRFDRAADGRVIVGLTSDDAIVLLDGPTGRPLGRTWKSTNTSLQENNRRIDLNHAKLASPFENSRLLTRVGDGSMAFNHMVSRTVLPADAVGRYQRSPNASRTRSDVESITATTKSRDHSAIQSRSDRAKLDDPRLIRQLPWAPSPAEWAAGKANMLKQAGLAIGLAFLVVLIPFWLIRAGVRRKELGKWRAALIASGASVFAICVLVFRFAPPGAIWRDVPWALPIVIGFAALPGLVWIATLIRNAFTGQWQRLSWLLGGTLFSSLALAALILWLTASQKPPEQHYSWQGWWFILLIGAQMVGVLLVVWKVIGPGVLWLWYRFRKPRTQSPLNTISP